MKRLLWVVSTSLVVFPTMSAASYFLRSDAFGLPGGHDVIRRLGFPMVFWEQGGFAYRYSSSVVALLADVAVAIVVGFLISVSMTKLPRKA